MAIVLLVSPFFFNDTATTEIYPLSLHAALPISPEPATDHATLCAVELSPLRVRVKVKAVVPLLPSALLALAAARESTRLYSSHAPVAFAVFLLNPADGLASVTFKSSLPSPTVSP